MRVVRTRSVVSDLDEELILCTRTSQGEAEAWLESHQTRLKRCERGGNSADDDSDQEPRPRMRSGPQPRRGRRAA